MLIPDIYIKIRVKEFNIQSLSYERDFFLSYMKDLLSIAKNKILVLDGAMGTMIQRYKLMKMISEKIGLKTINSSLKGNNDLLSLTRPDIIKEIHSAYFEAGADIVETNTFSGTSIAQSDYELEEFTYDINFHSAKIASEVAQSFTRK